MKERDVLFLKLEAINPLSFPIFLQEFQSELDQSADCLRTLLCQLSNGSIVQSWARLGEIMNVSKSKKHEIVDKKLVFCHSERPLWPLLLF